MNKPTDPADLDETDYGPLYAAHKKVYPQSVSGKFRKIKWTLMVLCLGVYYLLPFVRWDRGPNAPDQAVLVDLPNRRFYFFFIELWPQEVYYFTGLLDHRRHGAVPDERRRRPDLVRLSLSADRLDRSVLCGRALIEGDRRERMKKDKGGFTVRRAVELVSKHAIWLMIAWWTGGAWVLYFSDAPTLVHDLATGQAPLVAYIWIAILTFTTYTLAGFMREQVCVYMCPWPRIQAALTDEWALNVTYRYDRGEPRMSAKKAEDLRVQGLPAGDCVDCYQCVAVCPTGIDIRDGSQLECIQCGLCIDACDTVMAKIGRPAGLVAYDNDVNIKRRLEGKSEVFKLVRGRTVLYTALIAAVGMIMLYTLVTRSFLDIKVLHDRNPLFVTLSDGSVRNAYTLHFLNKRNYDRTVSLNVEGLPRVQVTAVGDDPAVDGRPLIKVGPDRTREVRVLLTVPRDAKLQNSTPVTFRITDVVGGETASRATIFSGARACRRKSRIFRDDRMRETKRRR